ncbi:MAG: glycosyltransferase family A protein [Candidatus Omnitrophota bacterium]
MVSVIIPTFNRDQFLPKAIESVLGQTYADFELIIIDDGSTDKTRSTVTDFDDDRIAYSCQENKGVSAARNRGIEKAHSGLICFLDSDDYWLPKKLEKQSAFMEKHPNLLLSQTEEIWIRHGHRVNAMKKHMKYAGMIYEKCLPLCLVTPSSVMIRKGLFKDVGLFDEGLLACEDYDLWLRVASQFEIGLIKENLIVKHGGHADQLSRRIPHLDQFRIQALEKILKSNLLTEDQRRATIRELKHKCRIYGNGCMKRGKVAEGEKYRALIQKY